MGWCLFKDSRCRAHYNQNNCSHSLGTACSFSESRQCRLTEPSANVSIVCIINGEAELYHFKPTVMVTLRCPFDCIYNPSETDTECMGQSIKREDWLGRKTHPEFEWLAPSQDLKVHNEQKGERPRQLRTSMSFSQHLCSRLWASSLDLWPSRLGYCFDDPSPGNLNQNKSSSPKLHFVWYLPHQSAKEQLHECSFFSSALMHNLSHF